jgi:Helix-turn-helix domain
MSTHALSWVFQHSDARGGDRLVLLVLADRAGEREDGAFIAWPGVLRIAREARLSERQVQRCLKNLVEAGEIAPSGTSNKGTTVYRLRGDILSGVTSATRRGDKPDAEGVTPTSPEPSLEPSLEPGTLVPSTRARIREAWELAPGMVRHKPAYFASPKVVTAIDKAVRLHGEEEVVAAVGLYAEIVRSPDYRWNYRWPLYEFLERGVDRFVPAADPKTEWRARRSNGRPGLTEEERAELERYDKGTVVLTGEGEDGDDLDVKAVLEKSRAEADRRLDEALDRELHPER